MFFHQMRNGYRLTNGFITDFSIPLTADLIESQTAIELIQDNPNHDSRALESRLPAADSGICDDMPSQFDSPVLTTLRFHTALQIMR